MSTYEWLMVVGISITIGLTSLGGIIRLTWYGGKKFDDAAQSQASLIGILRAEMRADISTVRELCISQMATLELRNRQHHEENIERLTRVETLVLNGGKVKKKRCT